MKIDNNHISPRVAYAIHYYNCDNPQKEIKNIQDLAERTEAELLRIPGCGRKTLNEIKDYLFIHGLKLKRSEFDAISKKNNEPTTLRDEYAMAALTGLLSNPKLAQAILREGPSWFDENAFAYADAMMAARTQK
jgi:hypothetical protein